jgi:hypothetical protein
MYCLVEKKSNQFNKEHVIPQLMGRYENGLTIKSVCEECNEYFGNTYTPAPSMSIPGDSAKSPNSFLEKISVFSRNTLPNLLERSAQPDQQGR